MIINTIIKIEKTLVVYKKLINNICKLTTNMLVWKSLNSHRTQVDRIKDNLYISSAGSLTRVPPGEREFFNVTKVYQRGEVTSNVRIMHLSPIGIIKTCIIRESYYDN